MVKMKISKRLQRVASFLPKGAKFADIGSDHAYLPCYVCQNDLTALAIAGEVNEGPYQKALETVQAFSLTDRIDVRLGDGLEVVQANEVKQIVIAGMGGSLVRKILNDGKEKLQTTKQIIAQPNVEAKAVRFWLYQHGFMIADEDIMEENGHFYEIINAERLTKQIEQQLDERAMLFGPILLQTRPTAFYKKWRQEAAKLEHVLQQIKRAKEIDTKKLNQLTQEWEWMKEVIKL